jgi:hypothetical protein
MKYQPDGERKEEKMIFSLSLSIDYFAKQFHLSVLLLTRFFEHGQSTYDQRNANAEV